MQTPAATREPCAWSTAQTSPVNVCIHTLGMASLVDSKILAFQMFVTKMQHVFLEIVVQGQHSLVLVLDQEGLDQQHLDQDQVFDISMFLANCTQLTTTPFHTFFTPQVKQFYLGCQKSMKGN